MPDKTFERVLEDALSLSNDEQRRLIDLLRVGPRVAEQPRTIQQIAVLKGKRPLDFNKVRRLGEFFPVDENIDDLVETVRELRRDRDVRSFD